MGISKLDLNLLVEQAHLEGQIHSMYESIVREDHKPTVTNEFKKVKQDLKVNADFMMTYGVGISAFISPVNELLKNKSIHITEYDVTLLVIAAFYILLSKSKEDIEKLTVEIKKRGIFDVLKDVVKFITKSLGIFKVVGNKMGVVISSLTDVLTFTFMSGPVLNTIKDLAMDKGFSIDNIEQIFAGLTLSAGGYLLKNILKKRLKEENELDWVHETSLSEPEQFLINKFMECRLEKIGSKNWEGWTRYVDKGGKILFLDDIDTGAQSPILWFDHGEIYLKLREMGLTYEEMQRLCIEMLYETHKRKVLTAEDLTIHLLSCCMKPINER